MIAVELSFGQILEAVKQMSASEKRKLKELLKSEDITIPLAHQEIVRDRQKKASANPELLLDFETAIQSLK